SAADGAPSVWWCGRPTCRRRRWPVPGSGSRSSASVPCCGFDAIGCPGLRSSPCIAAGSFSPAPSSRSTGPRSSERSNAPRSAPSAWVWVVVLGLVHTAAGASLYLAALSEVPATHAAILGYLEPAGAVVCGWLVLGEHLAAGELVGGALIVLAGWLVVRAGRAS